MNEGGAGPLVVATANVLFSLSRADARAALAGVLALEPDLVGLQEWYVGRAGLLRETGSLGPVPSVGPRLGGPRSGGAAYTWSVPLVGGCVVGARTDRFELLAARPRLLSGVGRADKPERWQGIEPPRIATVASYRDRVGGRTVTLVDYHLAPGVQAGGRYRPERPLLVARHRAEVRAVERIVWEHRAGGEVVVAVGDANFDGLRIAGLTSSWEGREQEPGTLGPHRKVDDVHGPGRPDAVVTVASASDHRAVVATWT
jgi:hypothetical protein